jgi:predicted GNAT family acetyltransferase
VVTVTRDPAEFEERTAALVRHELICNMVATVLRAIRGGHYAGARPLFAYALDAEGRPCLAALRTPPWPMLIGALPQEMAGTLLDAWLEHDPEVPGVSGPAVAAERVAAAWRACTGRSSRLTMRQAAHAVREVVDPPRPAPGCLRVGSDADRPVLARWIAEFMREAMGIEDDRVQRALDVHLAEEGLLLWEVDGVPVCMVGVRPRVEGVVRLGPVYTPPSQRGHGYGSSATAAASRRALAAGAHTCMLLTDLENPTSNKIYADVGYRRFADFTTHDFE